MLSIPATSLSRYRVSPVRSHSVSHAAATEVHSIPIRKFMGYGLPAASARFLSTLRSTGTSPALRSAVEFLPHQVAARARPPSGNRRTDGFPPCSRAIAWSCLPTARPHAAVPRPAKRPEMVHIHLARVAGHRFREPEEIGAARPQEAVPEPDIRGLLGIVPGVPPTSYRQTCRSRSYRCMTLP